MNRQKIFKNAFFSSNVDEVINAISFYLRKDFASTKSTMLTSEQNKKGSVFMRLKNI